mgnify:FL=1
MRVKDVGCGEKFTVAICEPGQNLQTEAFEEFHKKKLLDMQERILQIYQSSGLGQSILQNNAKKESRVEKELEAFGTFYDILDATNDVIEKSLLVNNNEAWKMARQTVIHPRQSVMQSIHLNSHIMEKSTNFYLRDITKTGSDNFNVTMRESAASKNKSVTINGKADSSNKVNKLNLNKISKATSPSRRFLHERAIEENQDGSFTAAATQSNRLELLPSRTPDNLLFDKMSPRGHPIRPARPHTGNVKVRENYEPSERLPTVTHMDVVSPELYKRPNIMVETGRLQESTQISAIRSPETLQLQISPVKPFLSSETPEKMNQFTDMRNLFTEPQSTTNRPLTLPVSEDRLLADELGTGTRTAKSERKKHGRKKPKPSLEKPLPRKLNPNVKSKEKAIHPFYEDSVTTNSPSTGRLKAPRLVYVFDKVAEVINTYQAKDPNYVNYAQAKAQTTDDVDEYEEMNKRVNKKPVRPSSSIQKSFSTVIGKQYHLRKRDFDEDGANMILLRKKSNPSLVIQTEGDATDFNQVFKSQIDTAIAHERTLHSATGTKDKFYQKKPEHLLKARPMTSQSIQMSLFELRPIIHEKYKEDLVDYETRLRNKLVYKHGKHSERYNVNNSISQRVENL